jgi:hypothetical protein
VAQVGHFGVHDSQATFHVINSYIDIVIYLICPCVRIMGMKVMQGDGVKITETVLQSDAGHADSLGGLRVTSIVAAVSPPAR